MSVCERDSMAIREMKVKGIMKVGWLEDDCLYQEVCFWLAMFKYNPGDSYMFNGRDWWEENAQSFKREFTACFNKLGYYEAERIPVQRTENEEEDWGSDLDPIPF